MARGGWISPNVAVNKVHEVVDFRSDAERLLLDHLMSGSLVARGRKVIGYESPPESDKMVLRDISNYHFTPKLDAEVSEVPKTIWLEFDHDADGKFLWKKNFINIAEIENSGHFVDISLRESEVNALIKKVRERNTATEPKPPVRRRRRAEWHDWVAALATLAHEHSIIVDMSRNDLLDLVTARLRKWGLDELPISTVGPTASAVIERFTSNPPSSPLLDGGKAPPKP